jgi:hypothetical protein
MKFKMDSADFSAQNTVAARCEFCLYCDIASGVKLTRISDMALA